MASRKKKTDSLALVAESNPRAELNTALLLARTQMLLIELEADLLKRARDSDAVQRALTARHETEKAQRRTADPLEVWERHFVTQVAASWVLSCVFVRTLEDRGLLGHARIAGPGALDSQRLFFEMAPSLTEREYLLTVFRELTRLPAAKELFDERHNPVWLLGPSAEVAKKLLALFRTPNAEEPAFRFGQDDTRFLGDLYQDLSEDVRDRFALLQTPRFVEKYILDRTLERAIERFGLDETTLIDPTCGSGHFLLGAFERLVDRRLQKEPGLDVREAARRALDAVYGADINPYAIGIARFRLTLAFLEKGGYARLREAPGLPVHLVVADSLLHNPQHQQSTFAEIQGQSASHWGGEAFALENEAAAREVLHRRFAAVVGNPPYITVKDAALRDEYRKLYSTAYKSYSMGAPFTERFFQLARFGGFVGMITANSFMKREFGKKLIEEYLPTVNLDGIVNTSGAYIPGHGTPTVLLFGSAEPSTEDRVLAVLAKRGEPNTPDFAEQGVVWRSIAEHGHEDRFENEYIGVARVLRATLAKFPWSLGGGGAADLREFLESRAVARLVDVVEGIGRTTVVGEDEVWIAERGTWKRFGIEKNVLPLVIGECVRDWAITDPPEVIYPYETIGGPTVKVGNPIVQLLWPWRVLLETRTVFGKEMKAHGRPWWEHLEHYANKLRTPTSITFAFVATHNHFVLDRGGKVFNRSAPVIKLKEDATEEDHLALLAYLNSSTACFWLKQVFHDKGSGTDKGKWQAERAKIAYEFAGTGMAKLPIPSFTRERRSRLVELARELGVLADRRSLIPEEVLEAVECARATPQQALTSGIEKDEQLTSTAIALQEEIDWLVYASFGLTCEDGLLEETVGEPQLPLGARPFEARRARLGDERGLDGQMLLAAPPPIPNEASMEARIQASGSEWLAILEVPEYKRRWANTPKHLAGRVERLEDRVGPAVKRRILDQLERSFFEAGGNSTLTARSIERLFTVKPARVLLELTTMLGSHGSLIDLLQNDAVPFVAAMRLTESGMEKRRVWELVWEHQRQEDAGKAPESIAPPPKYSPDDYRTPTVEDLRGKLDVPKERFISYPGCESDEDKEPVYGWAGWNHLQQAQALAALYQKRKTDEAWGKDRLTPMLAGLLELIPWVKQWHNEPSTEFGGLRLGDYFETFLDGECNALGLTRDDLRSWRPPEKTRAKKAAASKPVDDGEEAPAAPKRQRTRKKQEAPPEPAET